MASSDPTASTRTANRVLLVGLSGVEWSLLTSSIEAGGLPTLAALLRFGVSGTLAAPAPAVEPALWTSLITGQHAHKHGVLHAYEPHGSGRGTAPVTRPTVRTATLGAILSAAELTVNQIGWPVSHPVEQLRGVAVSDRFALEGRGDSLGSAGGWPWVTPPSAAKEIFARRRSPADVEHMSLAQLLPTDRFSQPRYRGLQEACRMILAESQTIFSATRWTMQRNSWDCTLCAFPAISRLRQALTNVLSPDEVQVLGPSILAGCYEHVDMLLGQLIAAAGTDATVLLVGTGSSRSSHPRLVLRRPKQDSAASLPKNASVLDVTPTVLALLGVPVADDMDGRVWTDLIFDDETSACDLPQTVDTWNTCIHPPPAMPRDTTPDEEPPVDDSVRHLVELGYVDPWDAKAKQQAEDCRRDTRRNRAVSLIDAGLHDEAIEELQQLKSDFPDWPAPSELLAESYLQRGQVTQAARELEYSIHHGMESARLYFALGRIAAAQRKWDEALLHYHVAQRLSESLRGLQLARGLALLRRRDFASAETTLQQASETEGRTPQLLDALAVCNLAKDDHAQAAEYALESIDHDVSYAPAHYHLALALVGMGRAADAKQALELSATLDPTFVAPWRWLARLCREHLDDHVRANEYQRRGRELIRQRRQTRQADNA